MKVLVVCLFVAAFLFAVAFVAKKRFGLLALALAAGSILSEILTENVSMAANIAGLPDNTQTKALVTAMLVILPALVLMFHGNSYRSFLGRVIGAAIFVTLAMTFIIQAIGGMLVWDTAEMYYYSLIQANTDYIIGGGLALGVIDLFLTKPAKKSEKSKEH